MFLLRHRNRSVGPPADALAQMLVIFSG
jgi:hypothetical protein